MGHENSNREALIEFLQKTDAWEPIVADYEGEWHGGHSVDVTRVWLREGNRYYYREHHDGVEVPEKEQYADFSEGYDYVEEEEMYSALEEHGVATFDQFDAGTKERLRDSFARFLEEMMSPTQGRESW